MAKRLNLVDAASFDKDSGNVEFDSEALIKQLPKGAAATLEKANELNDTILEGMHRAVREVGKDYLKDGDVGAVVVGTANVGGLDFSTSIRKVDDDGEVAYRPQSGVQQVFNEESATTKAYAELADFLADD